MLQIIEFMDKAFKYETFIRKAFQCKQYAFLGADFKVYRNLLESEVELQEEKKRSMYSDPLLNLAINYGVQIGIVSSNVREAISKVLTDYESKLTQIQIELLEVYLDELNNPSRKKIDEVMELADRIFDEVGLGVVE